jgi:transposase
MGLQIHHTRAFSSCLESKFCVAGIPISGGFCENVAIDAVGDGMPRAYSSDLRIRVIRAVEGGSSARGAARRLGVGDSTATAWVGRWRQTGSTQAKSQKGRSRSPLAAHAAWLLSLLGERADLTLEEIRELLGERGVQVAVSSIWRFFDRHGISFKKNRARSRTGTRRRGGGTAVVEIRPPAAV